MIALAVVGLLFGAVESRAFSRAEIGLEPVGAYTDLGPVVVRATTNAKKLRGELQVLADRLGADGFIVEERSPFAVYVDLPRGGVPSTGIADTAATSARAGIVSQNTFNSDALQITIAAVACIVDVARSWGCEVAVCEVVGLRLRSREVAVKRCGRRIAGGAAPPFT